MDQSTVLLILALVLLLFLLVGVFIGRWWLWRKPSGPFWRQPATATPVDTFLFHNTYVPLAVSSLNDTASEHPEDSASGAISRVPIRREGPLLLAEAPQIETPLEGCRNLARQIWRGFANLLQRLLGQSPPQDVHSRPLDELHQLGFLFSERIRIRPIGFTLERAPFYALSLTPGEVVTLRQKSFSKRAITLEQQEESETIEKIDYSSTYSTELSEQLSNSMSSTYNWGINQQVSGGFANQLWNLGGSTSANISSSETESSSGEESSKRVEQLSRKVESTQKKTHKTTMSLAEEIVSEEESIRVLRNDRSTVRKYYMRRVMQALHVSHERFDVRLCWAPYVKDPAKDVRIIAKLDVDEDAVREEVLKRPVDTDPTRVGEKPDEMIQYEPQNQPEKRWPLFAQILDNLDEPFSIPVGYKVKDLQVEISSSADIPGFESRDVVVITYDDNGKAKVWADGPVWHDETSIREWINRSSNKERYLRCLETNPTKKLEKGEGIIRVYWATFSALSDTGAGQPSTDMYYRFLLILEPTDEAVAGWEAKKDRWIEEEVAKEVAQRKEELKPLLAQLEAEAPPEIWIPSELMRRVIDDYHLVSSGRLPVFALLPWPKPAETEPKPKLDGETAELMHRMFEWEDLTAILFAPWWTDVSKVKDLRDLRTTFLNASWAKAYVPIRPGYERAAVQFLGDIGAIPNDGNIKSDIDQYIQQMYSDLLPLFGRDYQPSDRDLTEVMRPDSIDLTSTEGYAWRNDFEKEGRFKVLNRFIVTIPTDGVDIEMKRA